MGLKETGQVGYEFHLPIKIFNCPGFTHTRDANTCNSWLLHTGLILVLLDQSVILGMFGIKNKYNICVCKDTHSPLEPG